MRFRDRRILSAKRLNIRLILLESGRSFRRRSFRFLLLSLDSHYCFGRRGTKSVRSLHGSAKEKPGSYSPLFDAAECSWYLDDILHFFKREGGPTQVNTVEKPRRRHRSYVHMLTSSTLVGVFVSKPRLSVQSN